jgi:hypothetical protein
MGRSSAKQIGAERGDGVLAELLDVEPALSFGSVWERERNTAAKGGAAKLPGRGAERRPNLETRTLNQRRIPYYGGYRMRGRWLSDRYVGLRNAAWAVRNSRVSGEFNPLALRLVVAEAKTLLSDGEGLEDLVEAFAELLIRP